MGADLTVQVAAGKTPRAAYDRAVADADAYYGHREGYSGAINSKARGYLVVDLPPRFTLDRLLRLLDEYGELAGEVEAARDDVASYRPGGAWATMRGAKGRLRRAEAQLRKARARMDRLQAKVPASLDIGRVHEVFDDKWREPICVELRGAEARRYARVPRRRGERLYAFAGYAPC